MTKAESLYIKALAMRKRLYPNGHSDVAVSLNNLAAFYRDQGRYAEAETLYKDALAMTKRLFKGDHSDVASSLNNLGAFYNNQGRYAEAEPLLQQALAMRKRLFPDDDFDVASSLNNLAGLYKSQGKYAEAESLYTEALAMNKRLFPQDHPDVANSLNNLAVLYNSQGRYAEAESLYTEALAMRKRLYSEDHPSVAIVLDNLAVLYNSQGRYAEAEPLYTKTLAIQKRFFKGDHPDLAISLNNLGVFYLDRKKYNEAETFYKDALAMTKRLYSEDHPDLAISLDNLAGLYRVQGRYAEAEPLYRRALVMKKQLFFYDHPDIAASLSDIGILYQAQVQYSQALDYLIQAAEVQEVIIAENLLIGSEKQKRQFVNLFKGSTYKAISFHLTALLDNKEAAQLALTTILRRKGRVLDATGQTLQTLRENLDSESERLFVQLASTQTELANLSSRPLLDDVTQRQNIQKQQGQLDKEIKQLEARLSSRSAKFKQETTPVTIEQVQQAIPRDAALVEFIQYKPFDAKASTYGETRYAVYVLLPNGQMKWQDLGEAAVINAQIDGFRSLLNNGGERGLGAIQAESGVDATKQTARELDEMLMKPVRAMVGDATHLLLSPDSQLNTLPFAALVDKQDKYLVENYLITYLTSGRDLLRLQLKQNQDTSQPLLIANPTYSSQGVAVASADNKVDKDSPNRGRRSGELSNLEFASLPGTKVEGEAISQIVPNLNVLTEQQASENNLKQTKNPEFLHLATHGFFLPPQPEELNNNRNDTLSLDSQTPVFSTAENPLLRSGLALAGFNQRDSGEEDGVLTALEVTGLNLRGTKLVVMSACETGLGDVQAGEGVYGLRRAFTLAGAQSQLMSLWSVDDDGTKELMVEYYRRIQNGEARGEALRQVQLEMLKSENRNHPFYWAAFIPSGSWLPLDSGN
jgi:CHAT domain-containing protein/Tfp pilus assembly protein PilF